MTPQRLEVQKHHNVMFSWLVPRHEAGVAATTVEGRIRLPRQREEMTPQRLWKSEPKSQNKPEKRNPTRCRQPAISYTVHTKMRQNVLDLSAGLKPDGWRRKYTTSTPSIVAPGNRRPPTI